MNCLERIVAYAVFAASSSCYYYQLAKGQMDLRFNQVPIGRAVEEEQNPEFKGLLGEVSDIKRFSEVFIGLKNSDNYSGYYSTEREGITFVVTASRKDRIEPYTWHFPIIGDAPYKAFFDKGDALDLERELRDEGYDTYVFASPAYSTLGWFRDPVTTPMLRDGLFNLVDMIIHELAHTTLFVPGKVEFNEQLASFVGDKGAEQYMRFSDRYTDEFAAELASSKEKRIMFESVVRRYVDELQVLYSCGSCDALAGREKIFSDLTEEVMGIYPGSRDHWEFNNARLLNYVRYSSGSGYLQGLWDESGCDWQKFWVLVKIYAGSQD